MRTTSILVSLISAVALATCRPTTLAERADPNAAAIYKHCNRPGVFALTFDDGPEKYTWDLATSLKEQGVKATFFLNGMNSVDVLHDSVTTSDGKKTYLEVIEHLYDSGHEVASHTLSHKNLVGLSAKEVKEQMNKQSDIIYKAIGKRVHLMRPPEGALDSTSSKVLKDLGYSVILWDIDTRDWEHKGLKAQQSVIRGVMDKDVPNKTHGHISLEHDIHQDTVETLVPWYVQYVKEKGYEFVTVSDCIGVAPYS